MKQRRAMSSAVRGAVLFQTISQRGVLFKADWKKQGNQMSKRIMNGSKNFAKK